MRSFLNILNDLKILDGKLLTTKKVINIMSSDNSIVFDSDNSFNLDVEMSFLEFFETLIGCALAYESSNKPTKSRPVTSKITIRSEIPDSESEINAIVDAKNEDENAETQMEKQNDQDLDKIEEINLQNQTKEDEFNDFELWNEKNNYFFNKIFFPSADKYNEITRLVNVSL